jgi:hypothetical protein
VKDSVNDIVIKAESAFKRGQSWTSNELKLVDISLHSKDQIMDRIQTTVHAEIPSQCQEASYSQDATRGQLKTSFAFDVKG